jgi:hypothetical protein
MPKRNPSGRTESAHGGQSKNARAREPEDGGSRAHLASGRITRRYESTGHEAKAPDRTLLRRGLALEYATLGWNVVGTVVVVGAAVRARSVALAGFGLDSLVEIGASTVVVWQLTGSGGARERLALRLIRSAFLGIATYLTAQAAYTLLSSAHPSHSPAGIAWTAATFGVMLALAAPSFASAARWTTGSCRPKDESRWSTPTWLRRC